MGRKVRRGLAWSGLITIIERGWIFLLGIIIARWLEPSQYAAFAAGLTVVTVLISIDDFGVLATLINTPDEFDDIAPTGGLFAGVLGAALFLVLFVAAPFIVGAMGLEGFENVLRILGLTVVFDSLAIVPNGALMRELQAHRRGFVTGARLIVRTVVMVVVATQAKDAVGMAIAFTAGEAAAMVTSYLVTRRLPRWGFARHALRRIVRLGLPLALAGVLALATFTVDNFIVGGRLGAEELGFYLLAFNIATWPVNIIGGALVQIANPAFAEYGRQGQQLAPLVTQSMVWLLELALPVTALIIGLAAPLVEGVYGDRWSPAVPIVRAIAVLGLARLVVSLGRDALAAARRSPILIIMQTGWLVLVIVLVTAGVIIAGATGAAWGHVVAASIVTVAMLLALRHYLQVSISDLRAGPAACARCGPCRRARLRHRGLARLARSTQPVAGPHRAGSGPAGVQRGRPQRLTSSRAGDLRPGLTVAQGRTADGEGRLTGAATVRAQRPLRTQWVERTAHDHREVGG